MLGTILSTLFLILKNILLDTIMIKIYRLENWTLGVQVTCSQIIELKGGAEKSKPRDPESMSFTPYCIVNCSDT